MSKFPKQLTKGQIMATRTLEDLVKDAIENLIMDGKLVIEDNEGNKIEDLSINIKNDEEDFDDEDCEENEEDSSEDDEEDEE
jgi:hypothetical protein